VRTRGTLFAFKVSKGPDSFIMVHSFSEINDIEAPVIISKDTSVPATFTLQTQGFTLRALDVRYALVVCVSSNKSFTSKDESYSNQIYVVAL